MEVTAQSINVSLSIPATPFQDCDSGAMAFGDIDNDGDNDLIMTGKGGPIKTTLYLNDGLGNFTAATGTPFINVSTGTVGFSDLNNDGFIDLLITGVTPAGTPETATLYMNNGNGTFSIAVNNLLTPSQGGDFDFADIDNDGDKDIILTGSDANSIAFTRLYSNNGFGVFTEVTNNPFQQIKESSVAFLDIDNDNDKDVILAGINESNVITTKLYNNNGAGIFTEVANTPFTGINGGDIAVADSDNDGDMDIFITGGSDSARISKLYTNNGTGNFTEVTGTPFIGSLVSSAEFADFDNDGDKDILLVGAKITSNPNAFAHIYENTGANNFVLSNQLIPTYLSSIAIADIDGDNDLDFIIGGTHFELPFRNPKLYKNNLTSLSTLNFDNSSNFSFYPNPTNDIVNITSTESIDSIIIYNLLGQKIFSKEINSNEFRLDISNQPTGTYIAKINSKRKSESIKLIKI
jgi:hypothetical protein